MQPEEDRYEVSGLNAAGTFVQWTGMASSHRDAVIKAEGEHGHLDGVSTTSGVEPAINRVGRRKVGDEVTYDGVQCRITSFPTRYSVCLDAVRPKSGEFSSAKISVRELGGKQR